MGSIVEACAKRPVGVSMAVAGLLGAGIFSAATLPLDRLPELDVPRVAVEAGYPGMGAEEVRTQATIPLEDGLASVKGLRRQRSVSRDGSAVIALDFSWGTDPEAAAAAVREAIDSTYPRLPEGALKPLVLAGDPEARPLAIVSVASRAAGPGFASDLADRELRARYRRIDGVASAVLAGGRKQEVVLRLDEARAAARGLDAASLARVVATEWVDVPAGSAAEGDRELVVVAAGRPPDFNAAANAVLPLGPASERARDLAAVALEEAERSSVFVADGEERTALELYRRPGADPVETARRIREATDEARGEFGRDAEIEIVFDDSRQIVRGVRSLGLSALLAMAGVVLALFFFLGEARGSLLAALSVPFSAAASFCALALCGRSLNGMSLGGLALGVGLVSDTSVVVLDLLSRRDPRGCADRIAAAAARAASVSGSSFASTLTTAVVFAPVYFLPGPLGALFGDLSLALVASIFAGWVYSQACLPALYLAFGKEGSGKSAMRRTAKKNSPTRRLERAYRGLLFMAFRKPAAFACCAAVAAAAGTLVLAARPAAFVAADEATEIEVAASFPPGARMERLGFEGAVLSGAVSRVEGVASAFGRAGAEEEDLGRRADGDYEKERLVVRCALEQGADPDAVLASVLEAARRVGAGDVGIEAGFPRDPAERLLGLSSAWTLAATASDPAAALRKARTAEAALLRDGSIAGTALRPSGRRPELRVEPDREAIAAAGLSSARLAEFLRASTEGLPSARLEVDGRYVDVRVAGEAAGAKAAGEAERSIGAARVMAPSGSFVHLASVARVSRVLAPAAAARRDRADVVYVDAFPAPGRKPEASAAIDAAAAAAGVGRADESAFRTYRATLLATVGLVLLLLYLVMAAQFESLSLPLLFMATIPFSLAGAGPALALAGGGLDSGSVLGLMVLFGIAVNNGIVLYERSRDLADGGTGPVASAYLGAADRLMSVAATTATTLIALVPVVAAPMGASQRSMAAAMLGGMAASTLVALFVLPPLFARHLASRKGGRP